MTDNNKESIFDIAITDAINAHLEREGDPNAVYKDGMTYMHLAGMSNKTDNLEKLLQKGGDITVEDAKGNTLLHMAAGDGPEGSNPEMVAYILHQVEKKALKLNFHGYKEFFVNKHNNDGKSAFLDTECRLNDNECDEVVEINNHFTTLCILLEHGADPTKVDMRGESFLGRMIENHYMSNYHSGFLDRVTPEQREAFDKGYKEVVTETVKKGLDLTQAGHGETAVTRSIHICNPKTLELFLELGANPNEGGKYSLPIMSVLHNDQCSFDIRTEMLKTLVKYDVGVNAKSMQDHQSAVELCTQKEHFHNTPPPQKLCDLVLGASTLQGIEAKDPTQIVESHRNTEAIAKELSNETEMGAQEPSHEGL